MRPADGSRIVWAEAGRSSWCSAPPGSALPSSAGRRRLGWRSWSPCASSTRSWGARGHDARLYFASSPRTATARNVVRDPRVVAHLEDARAVAIIEGLAERCDAALLPAAVPELYGEKFGLRLRPAGPGEAP